MKNINFIFNENQTHLIKEFENLYCLPNFKTIRSKIKLSYKKDLEKFLYYFKVWQLTEENATNLKDISNRGKDYHIDHIIPISYGYKYNIDFSIIGSLSNLQLISKKDNFNKCTNITEQTKKALKNLNIEESKLKTFERSKIFVPVKEKDEFINVSNIDDKHRLSSFPIGGNKLGN